MEVLMRNTLSCFVFLIVLGLSGSLAAADLPDVVELLFAWQNSTADSPGVLPDAAFTQYRDSHNAHELALAAELCGPVEARRLIGEFNWISRLSDGQIILHAVPRDELTQLFCPGIDVAWDAEHQRPASLRFYDDPASARAVTISPPTALEPASVTRVAARPVHPDPLIQLASLNAIESPVDAPALALPEVLRRWAEATSRIERAHLEFVYYSYDSVYFIEQRCHGRFRWEAPDRACYELFNTGDDATAEIRRKDPAGNPFTRGTAEPLMYCWNGTEVIFAHPAQRTYEVFDVPSDPEVRQTGSWGRIWCAYADPHCILPGVVDVHSDGLHNRFEWALLRQDEEQILLCGLPLQAADQQELSQLQVILDPHTFRTRATRLYDVTGSRETVHVFCESKFNDDVNYSENWTPDLTGYELLNSAPPAPPATIAD